MNLRGEKAKKVYMKLFLFALIQYCSTYKVNPATSKTCHLFVVDALILPMGTTALILPPQPSSTPPLDTGNIRLYPVLIFIRGRNYCF